MFIEVALLALGCGLLFFGGDWLVDGITGLSAQVRVPPVLIAFVVMGFGTSAPELFVAMNAMLVPSPDIAMGNVVGSNIANLLLVLAVAAIIAAPSICRTRLLLRFGWLLSTVSYRAVMQHYLSWRCWHI